jgi:hypothetical protein
MEKLLETREEKIRRYAKEGYTFESEYRGSKTYTPEEALVRLKEMFLERVKE